MVLTCNATEGVIMSWFYNGMRIGNGFVDSDPIDTPRDVTVSGFMFSTEFTSNMIGLTSTLSFSADAAMNSHNVSCRVGIFLSGGGVNISETTQLIQITQIGKPKKYS